MSKNGPIVWLEDDHDDQQIIEEVLRDLKPVRRLCMFDSGIAFLDYLRRTEEQPFLILCDVNLPGLSGLEIRNEINKDEALRNKAIPFIFFSTTAEESQVRRAYDMVVQGYFEKGNNLEELQLRLKKIFDYWNDCKHPNSFSRRKT